MTPTLNNDALYRDFVNNFLSIERFAEYYDLDEKEAETFINHHRELVKERGYY